MADQNKGIKMSVRLMSVRLMTSVLAVVLFSAGFAQALD
jgi:hypothetical protein